MFERWRQTKLQKRNTKKVPREQSVLRTQIIVGVLIVVTISLLVTGVWYGTRVASMQITQVEVVGGFTIPHTEVEDTVREQLVGTYLKLVPRSFRATYPKDEIIAHILNTPRMKNVHVEIIDTQKIVVVFEEYRPSALWCENYESSRCLFLDELGFAFSEAPELSGGAFVRYVDLESTPEKKQQAFESDFVRESQTFAEMLAEELDLYVTYIEKVDELDVLYTVSGGGVLKVSQMMSTEDSFKNLESILGSEDFIHLQNGAFQYIDLRFGDKIFLNEEEVIEEIATSTEA
jgi:hypothetical protein